MLPPSTPFALTCTSGEFESALEAIASIRRFYSSAPIWLCLVDKNIDLEPLKKRLPEAVTLVLAEDLNVTHWPSVAFQYSAQELCAAVKPWIIRYVLEKSDALCVVFLGNNARLKTSIDAAWEHMQSNEILLIPMNARPTDPFDPVIEKRPLREGIYNSSFLIVKKAPQALEMVDWWKERALQEFWNRPVDGYFLDQKWLNFVPRYWEKTTMIDSAPFLEIGQSKAQLTSGYDCYDNGQRIYGFARRNYAWKEPWPALENPFDPKNRRFIENNFQKSTVRSYLTVLKKKILAWIK